MNKKVAIGLSGGVDSAVAALLLKQQGYEVTGVNLRFTENEADSDAKRVADFLGIDFVTADCRENFKSITEKYFLTEYLKGRTPIPCAVCNRKVKFESLINMAKKIGADFVATGHYAVLFHENERTLLVSSASKKDQSYFLSRLTNEQLSRCIFPLTDIEKPQIRAIAEENKIPVAQKKDSQELCFVPDDDYAAYIIKKTGIIPEKGDFIDKNGTKIGTHNGIIYYTIGQRKGLGGTFGKPMFVIDINPENNTVTLGEEGSQLSSYLCGSDASFLMEEYRNTDFSAFVKIRCQAKKASAKIKSRNVTIEVEFDEMQKSVTKGQLAVVYDENGFVICSAFID